MSGYGPVKRPGLQKGVFLSYQRHRPSQNQVSVTRVVGLHWPPVLQNQVKVSHDLRTWRTWVTYTLEKLFGIKTDTNEGKEQRMSLCELLKHCYPLFGHHISPAWFHGQEPKLTSFKGNSEKERGGSITSNVHTESVIWAQCRAA